MKNSENTLELRDLKVEFDTYGGVVKAVRGVTYNVRRGKTLAVVGESGSGKSVTVQSFMGLIPTPPGRIVSGEAVIDDVDLLALKEKDKRQYRGRDIGMIFQDPMSSLNPTMRIGDQIAEMLRKHKKMNRAEAWSKAVELLDLTRIPEADKRVHQYPFEFSGGMLQRVMIAMAVACEPKLLIADEPTTALDVTIQDQVLEIMRNLQKKNDMSIIFITHDLGVVARMADDVAVMYAGQIVEQGSVEDIFYKSSHPYTVGLRQAMPANIQGENIRLEAIPGSPPDLFSPPKGCAYAARCPHAMAVCRENQPLVTEITEGHTVSCWLQHEGAPEVEEELLYQKHFQETVV